MSRPGVMPQLSTNPHAGTAGGTLLSLWTAILHADLTETILLSALGAIVSFLVSALLQWIVKKVSKR